MPCAWGCCKTELLLLHSSCTIEIVPLDLDSSSNNTCLIRRFIRDKNETMTLTFSALKAASQSSQGPPSWMTAILPLTFLWSLAEQPLFSTPWINCFLSVAEGPPYLKSDVKAMAHKKGDEIALAGPQKNKRTRRHPWQNLDPFSFLCRVTTNGLVLAGIPTVDSL